MQRLVLWNQCYTMSTPDTSGPSVMVSILDDVAQHKKIPNTKLLPRSIYDILTHILKDFSTALYHVQCRQTLAVYPIEKKQSNRAVRSQAFRYWSSFQRWKANSIFTWVLLLALSFRRRFPLLFLIRHLTRLGCSLNALSSTSWLDTPLTADWLQVCFGTRPRLSFLKHL